MSPWGKQFVDKKYSAKLGKPYTGTKGYYDFRELLANKEIDAVLISHARLSACAPGCGRRDAPAKMFICKSPRL